MFFDFLKNEYTIELFVQFNRNKKPCICGDSIRNLESITVKAFSRQSAEKLALDQANQAHPEFKGLIQTW